MENIETFKSDPGHYEPQFGGFCAFGIAVGKQFDGDPQMWTIHNDKLYLNLNSGIQEKFSEDVAGNIEKANANRDTIRNKAVSDR